MTPETNRLIAIYGTFCLLGLVAVFLATMVCIGHLERNEERAVRMEEEVKALRLSEQRGDSLYRVWRDSTHIRINFKRYYHDLRLRGDNRRPDRAGDNAGAVDSLADKE